MLHVVGNKTDARGDDSVPSKLAADFAEGIQANFSEVSAKDNTGISEAFLRITQELLRRKGRNQITERKRKKMKTKKRKREGERESRERESRERERKDKQAMKMMMTSKEKKKEKKNQTGGGQEEGEQGMGRKDSAEEGTNKNIGLTSKTVCFA